MPEALARNCRRVSPCLLASSPPSSLMRASSRRCFAVWGAGMNSSLETLWVGTGPGNAAVSAGASALSSASLISLIAVSLLSPGAGGVSTVAAHVWTSVPVPRLCAATRPLSIASADRRVSPSALRRYSR